MKYELWQSDAESSYALFASGREAEAGGLPADARLIWTTEAKTWEEEKTMMHKFLGRPPYEPTGPPAPCPKCGATYYPNGSAECPNCGLIS